MGVTNILLNERNPIQKDTDYCMISFVYSSGKDKIKLQFQKLRQWLPWAMTERS